MSAMGFRLVVAGAALFAFASACAYETARLPAALPTPSENSSIYARDGQLITTLQAEENRENIALASLPDHLPEAVIAIEDQRYYEHSGLDMPAVIRAARANTSEGEIAQGGSTITQQYVKNVYLDDDQTVGRKVEEAALALQLERTYSKDLILELYLNTIYFGRGRYGVQAAAYEYFGKPATEVSIAEAAMLAGLIQAPSEVDPYFAPEAALQRRTAVLDQMLDLGSVTENEYEVAVGEPLTLVSEEETVSQSQTYPAAHFVEEVKQWIIHDPRFGDTRDERINLLFGGGLRIVTTVDLDLQAEAEAIVGRVLPDPNTYPDAAVVTVHPGTGQVLAMVGGRDYWGSEPDAKYNLATGKGRQTGSSFKPIVFAAALQDGMSPLEKYDGPGSITIARENAPLWHVRGGCGSVTLIEATVRSCNTVYAQLIMDVGAQDAIDTAHALGVTSELQSNEGAVLGTNDATALDMAAAFATFSNHGYHVPPTLVRRIVKADGTILYESSIEAEPALTSGIADLVTWTLAQVIERGTGTGAKLPDRPAAGKTGTTDSNQDAWFVGYTPQRATAVWVGFPQAQIPMVPPTTPISVYGGTWPADIWREVMVAAHTDLDPEPFATPPPLAFAGLAVVDERIENGYVPSVLGRGLKAATIALIKEGYLAEIYWRDEPGLPQGAVLDQYPPAGEVHQTGRSVTLEIAVPRTQEPNGTDPQDPEAAGDDIGPFADLDGDEVVLRILNDYYNLDAGEQGPPETLGAADEAVG